MNNDNIRVRFAPSPTGRLHVGNVRTAILNWLCARHSGGKFILRIEDTDAERSTEESELGIINQLKWLGLDWDEGPRIGGPFGPYRQSERENLYKEHVRKLFESGKAYQCFCSKDELEIERKKAVSEKGQFGYSGKCRRLTDQQITAYINEGRKPVVRFEVPDGSVTFDDIVQGTVKVEKENIADFIIQREDGSSPYNFAAVVDDALMEITLVIRGNDHVSNTPKQVLLYDAFGYSLPKFAHIPMITGQDGVRLSKRHGHSSVEEFKEAGYLPEALINFLSLLSWSSESGDETLPVDRLIKEFDLSRVSKSPAQFDTVKLNWMNGVYIRSKSIEELTKLAKPYMEKSGLNENDPERLFKIMSAVKDRAETFSEFPKYADLFFRDSVLINGDEEREIVENPDSQSVLRLLLKYLSEADELTIPVFQEIMKRIQKETGIKGKGLWMPVRVALTGETHGPELTVVLDILGRDRCLKFLESVIE